MGAVYAARDESLGRWVALKLVEPSVDADADKVAEANARLEREASAVAALSHANAVAVYDVGEHEGAPYLAMELVDGETLRQKIGKDIPITTRIEWLCAIADALGAAHAKGIIHRDVKPENVMIRGDGVVKVLDFGIARAVKSAAAPGAADEVATPLPTITTEGIPLGTPLYMAPEQLMGKPLDARADQFSWAVLAYELLAGKPPWSVASGVEMVSQILGADPPALSDAVPDAARAAIQRALAKSAGARFASMADAAAALRGERPAMLETVASPVAATRAFRTPVRGRRGSVIVALGALLAAALLLARFVAKRPTPGASTTAAVAASPNPEALRAHREGMAEVRRGAMLAAVRAFERATALDPAFGAAWVRLVAHDETPDTPLDVRRRRLRGAKQAIESLDELDRALLAAFEPLVVPDVPDGAEWERRVAAVAARWRDDAEVALITGNMFIRRGKLGEARVELERALRLDPNMSAAAFEASEVARWSGDEARWASAIDACLAADPDASNCLWAKALLADYRGDWETHEATTRRRLALEPDNGNAYLHLHQARLLSGAPVAALADLAQRFAQSRPEKAQTRLLQVDAVAHAYTGGFEEATRLALRMQELERGEVSEVSHLSGLILIAIAEETGDRALESAQARAFIESRGSWIPQRTRWSLLTLRPALRLGIIDEARHRALLASWAEQARSQLDPPQRNAIWFFAHAAPARTRREAEEALAIMPVYEPLPPPMAVDEYVLAMGVRGAVHALVEDWDRAIPDLQRALATCFDAGPSLLLRHWWRLLLGNARAAKGDTAGACAEYARVVAQLGNAKPRSVTAEEARQRSEALRCSGK
jgi:serine/threonine-protein kinase